MLQELSIESILAKTSEMRMWYRAQEQMPDMWQEIHV